MCHAITVSHLPLMYHAIMVSTMCAMPSAADVPCHHGQPSATDAHAIMVSTMCTMLSAADAPCHHGQHDVRSISALRHLPLMCHDITVSMMCDPSHPAMLFVILVSTMRYPTSASSCPPRSLSVLPYHYPFPRHVLPHHSQYHARPFSATRPCLPGHLVVLSLSLPHHCQLRHAIMVSMMCTTPSAADVPCHHSQHDVRSIS